NVMAFAGEVLVPLTPCPYGYLGLQQIQADVAKVRRNLGNKRLRLLGILLAQTEKTKVAADFEREMRAAYGEMVFKTTVPRSVRCVEAAARTLTIFEYARLSPGALAYEALCGEVLSRGREQEGRDGVAEGGDLRRFGAA